MSFANANNVYVYVTRVVCEFAYGQPVENVFVTITTPFTFASKTLAGGLNCGAIGFMGQGGGGIGKDKSMLPLCNPPPGIGIEALCGTLEVIAPPSFTVAKFALV